MTQLAQNPAYLQIEDQLDTIGQKYRVMRILRGMMLWLTLAVASTVAAALLADRLGEGRGSICVAVIWIAWLVLSAFQWFVRPLLIRPKIVEVARMVERRVDGLQNGLTNSVLLMQADDLAQSPWIPAIFDEVLATARTRPIGQAVKLFDLRSLGIKLLAVMVPALLVTVLMPARFAHGWQQMFTPGRFVPMVGQVQILDVQPGDVSLVAGQPLEIAITARGPQAVDAVPDARLIFDDKLPEAKLPAIPGQSDGAFRYSYRLDHVDQSMKYRVEIGGTQSAWYSVQVVPQVRLQTLDVTINPPKYTGLPVRTLTLKPEDIDKTPITVQQGSQVEIGATIDVPAKKAVLMVNSDDPQDMTPALGNHRFFRATPILADSTVFVGLMGGDQIISKLPEQGLVIHCTPDMPPSVTMQWPAQEMSVPPAQDFTIKAEVKDDFGVQSARLLVAVNDGEMAVVPASEQRLQASPEGKILEFPLKLKPEDAKHNGSITVQVEATDDRDLVALSRDLGPQTTQGPKMTIHFRDPKQIAADDAARADRLEARLMEMLKLQETLYAATIALLPPAPTTRPGPAPAKPASILDRDAVGKIGTGQTELRAMMRDTAEKFEFDARTMIVQKTLLLLALNPGTEAVDLSSSMAGELVPEQQLRQGQNLRIRQEAIITTLRALLARLNSMDHPTTMPTGSHGEDLLSRADAFKKLDEALKQFMKEEKRIIDQTASLAKKPVDNYDDQDKKNLDDLRLAQEKLDAFMQEKLADFSKNAEQDLSNPALLKEMMEVYSEVTMATKALDTKPLQIAVPLEESGLEQAKELESNIEKWLENTPDRNKWTPEDPLGKNDSPMAELPKELEDMVGQLMEEQEDLDQDMQDQSANWQDSIDKGIGWGATDGPIADMSAKGVTGNQLPKNNDMQGRSGEGRNGKSEGEFVGDTAKGKGGRNTPTRLEPTPFEKGQVHDESKDPVGGATGGGKISGGGGEGLEGPVPPKMKQEMQRLAQKQAEIRNTAERLNLQYQLGRYDNFKLLQGIALMRQVESDFDANRYQNALRHKDEIVDDLESSHLLVGGQIHVDQDTTPTTNHKMQKEINDAMQGNLPPAWKDSLKEYYQKLGEE